MGNNGRARIPMTMSTHAHHSTIYITARARASKKNRYADLPIFLLAFLYPKPKDLKVRAND